MYICIWSNKKCLSEEEVKKFEKVWKTLRWWLVNLIKSPRVCALMSVYIKYSTIKKLELVKNVCIFSIKKVPWKLKNL